MQDKNDFEIKFGYDKMNFEKITEMLAGAYWSKHIKMEEVKQGAKNSALVAGVFHQDDQVGYARVISDKTRFAYILDVFVDKRFRKKGIGQWMVDNILNHEDLKDVYQWLLMTKDAHEVYKKSGFTSLKFPDWYMEIRHDRPDR